MKCLLALINVGKAARSIAVYEGIRGASVYVANYGSNSTTVINGTTNTYQTTRPVGVNPFSIAANPDSGSIYVADYGSDGVSVIEPTTNSVVTGLTFNYKPANSGHIICNDVDATTNLYFYVSSGTNCKANPNKGLEFNSWVQDLQQNSTRTIKTRTDGLCKLKEPQLLSMIS